MSEKGGKDETWRELIHSHDRTIGGEAECEFDGDPDGAGRLRYPAGGFEFEGTFLRGIKQG